MYQFFLILTCLFTLKYYVDKYFKINKMLRLINSNGKSQNISKYNKIKFILIYKKGDNIKDSIKSLLQMTIQPSQIIIIGKDIKIKNCNKIKIYNNEFNENILETIISKHQTKNDIIGIYQTNTIFNKYLSEKIIHFFNNYNYSKVYVLHDIITKNIFLEKYNFYNQLNKYSCNPKYDFFTTNIKSNGIILKSFLISKIYNMNSLEYCLNFDYDNHKYHNIIIFIKYWFYYYYPLNILLIFIIQIIFQIIIIFKNLSFNQALQGDIFYIFVGNFISFLKSLLPQIKLNLKKFIYKENNSNNLEIELIDKVDNGKYYQVKNSNLKIIHLYGNDYEKGYAYGKLCKEDFIKILSIIESYYKNVEPSNNVMKHYYKNNNSMKDCLLSVYNQMKQFIGFNHMNMLKGISDGSKIDFEDIITITLIPELYHQHCMLLSHNTTDANIFIRTLDYFFHMDNQILRVYHNDKNNSYCELGIPGTIWCISAVSERLICLGETSGRFKYETNLLGTPFYLYFKDILEKCNNLDETFNYLNSIKRNNNLFVIISSLLEKKGYLINSKNMKKYNSKNFYEYMKEYSNFQSGNIVNDTIFEYSDPIELNNTLLNIYDLSLDSIKNSIFKMFKTGGNHTMIVKDNYDLYIQVKNKNIPAFDNITHCFNLKKMFST